MDQMVIAAICGFALLSAVTCVKIAAGKARRPWLWGAIGLVLNLPGLLVATVVPVHAPAKEVACIEQLMPPAYPEHRTAA